jgi:hypothetical protein
MTFASADLNGVPWEIVIKAYREKLMNNSHEHLTNYATDFFDFITSNSLLFPIDVQEKRFLSLADRSAAKITVSITEKTNYASTNEVGQAALIIDALDARERALSQVTLIPNAVETDIDNNVKKYLGMVVDSFRKDSFYAQHVSFPKIISARSDDAVHPRRAQQRRYQTVGLPYAVAHPCAVIGACAIHYSRWRTSSEFASGAPRQRSASDPGTRGAQCRSGVPHTRFARAI